MKKINEKAIVTKRGKSYIGGIDDNMFLMDGVYDGDIPPEGYITLYEYLQLQNPKITKKESESIRKELGYTQVYIYVDDYDDFWAYINPKCKTCQKECKQSHKVDIVICKKYKERK